MKFTISTHRVGSRRHDAVSGRVIDVPKQPEFWTVIRLTKPPDKVFKLETLAAIEEMLTPLFEGQYCTSIGGPEGNGKGPIVSARFFWNQAGVLTGEGAIHALAHWIIAAAEKRKRRLMILKRNDPRRAVPIIERVYPTSKTGEQMNIVLSGRYHKAALKHHIVELYRSLEIIMSKGEPVVPPKQKEGTLLDLPEEP